MLKISSVLVVEKFKNKNQNPAFGLKAFQIPQDLRGTKKLSKRRLYCLYLKLDLRWQRPEQKSRAGHIDL